MTIPERDAPKDIPLCHTSQIIFGYLLLMLSISCSSPLSRPFRRSCLGTAA